MFEFLIALVLSSAAGSVALLAVMLFSRARLCRPVWLRAALAVVLLIFLAIWYPAQERPGTFYQVSLPRVQAAMEQAGRAAAQYIRPQDGQALSAQAGLRISLPQVLFMLWAAGMAVMLARTVVRHVQFMRCLKRWRVPDDSLRDELMTQAVHMGSYAELTVYRCALTEQPMLAGVLHPALYLPQKEYAEQELTQILRHELTHFLSHDLWLRVVFSAVQSIHWFNPLMRLLDRELTAACEMRVDEKLMRGQNRQIRLHYAMTILDSVKTDGGRLPVLTMSFSGGKKAMKRRMEQIIKETGGKLGVLCLALVLMIAAGMPGVLAEEAAQQSAPCFASSRWHNEESDQALLDAFDLILACYALDAQADIQSEEVQTMLAAVEETGFINSLFAVEREGDEVESIVLRAASLQLLSSATYLLESGEENVYTQLAALFLREVYAQMTGPVEGAWLIWNEDDGSIEYLASFPQIVPGE